MLVLAFGFYNDKDVVFLCKSTRFKVEKMHQYSTLNLISDNKLDLVDSFWKLELISRENVQFLLFK